MKRILFVYFTRKETQLIMDTTKRGFMWGVIVRKAFKAAQAKKYSGLLIPQ